MKTLTYKEWLKRNPNVKMVEEDCPKCGGSGEIECYECGNTNQCPNEECIGGKVKGAHKQYEAQLARDKKLMERLMTNA